jgi:hypothetical protein
MPMARFRSYETSIKRELHRAIDQLKAPAAPAERRAAAADLKRQLEELTWRLSLRLSG